MPPSYGPIFLATLPMEPRMYLPPRFSETSLTKLHDLIDAYNFGTLFYQAGDRSPEIVHIPFILDRTSGANGAILGHVAKANPVWRLFDGCTVVTVVFQGPHGYISPAWYASRQQVPTWVCDGAVIRR